MVRSPKTHVVKPTDDLVGAHAVASLVSSLRAGLDSGLPITVDLSAIDAIDGACLAAVLAASAEAGESRPLSVIVSPALSRAFTDWRIDTAVSVEGVEGA
jgi:anti-anti-sigma regulatory factor